MKNVLKYYYKLVPSTIHQLNNDYRCLVNKDEYLFKRVQINAEEILTFSDLNEYLINNGLLCHKIIKNINQSLITYIDGNSYILLHLLVSDREIIERDLLAFSGFFLEKSKYPILDRSNWYNMWTQKIDYIEYQVSQLGKNYPLIRKTINYYIGLAETSISLISNQKKNLLYLCVSHKRIKNKARLRDLYDPLSLVLDVRVRDLSEFYKERFFSNKIEIESLKQMLLSYKLNNSEVIYFLARLIFPSYYFDCYQEIVLGQLEEIQLNRYIHKVEEYQMFLKYVYFYLRQFYDIPEIEWIIKT